ncbi:MAG: hypothetical protein IJL97_02395, partial [Lachnospiraceae bacterium]|nr:hypothetical protein [Lachnospiraceae bacterium]
MDLKKIVRAAVLAVFIIMIFALAGCKGESNIIVDQTLTIDENLKGTREVKLSISKDALKNFFDGDVENIRAITEKCPAGVVAALQQGGDGTEVKISVTFGNYNQYMTVISNVLGDYFREATGYEGNVYYDNTVNNIRQGMTLRENFGVMDMIRWFYDQMVKAEYISEDDPIEEIFLVGETKINLNGEEYKSDHDQNANIVLTNVEPSGVRALDIYTQAHYDGKINAELVFRTDGDVSSAFRRKLSIYLRGAMPTGSNLTTQEDKNGEYITYTIVFTADNEADYVNKLNKILGTENAVFSISQSGDEADDDALKARSTYTIYADASYFLNYADPESEMSYSLGVDTRYSADSIDSQYGYITNRKYDYDYEKSTMH